MHTNIPDLSLVLSERATALGEVRSSFSELVCREDLRGTFSASEELSRLRGLENEARLGFGTDILDAPVEVVGGTTEPWGVMRTGALLMVFVDGTAAERVSGIETGRDIGAGRVEDIVCLSRLLEGGTLAEEVEEPLKLSRSPLIGWAFFDGEIKDTEANSFPSLVRFCFTGGDTSTFSIRKRKS